jgi:hypothetical protein
VREFLLQTAILDRLTGPLSDALTGHDHGSHMLTTLQRANLFLVALDDQGQWHRNHHLFADVLRARLFAEQPDLVPLLHQRASCWYEAHDLAEEAVRHALATRDFDRAAYLMELAVPAIQRNRQEAMLLDWLKTLPDDVVRRSPVLSVFYGYLLMESGDLDAFEPDSTTRNAPWLPYQRGRLRRGPRPRSSARCRRPSPCTAPRSRRHAAMWPVRQNTLGAHSTWPAPATISLEAVRSGS